jgi:magnesium transporter
MIYFTELDNLPIYDVKGDYQGRMEDLTVDPGHSLRVSAYLVKTPKKQLLSIKYAQMQSLSMRAAQTSTPSTALEPYVPDESLLRVKKDVLDQQIIDVNNRKVVRVNDVDFEIHPTDGHSELRIIAVNVGFAAAIRRLLQGTIAKHRLRSFTESLPSRTIPWEFVNLIEPDPARRLKLRLSYERLGEMHPADIAGILEELTREEQKAVIESLDEETAAQALSEIPTKMQAELLESIPPEKAADIVEEMPPDMAADVLQEMPPEASMQVLNDMDKEEASDVRELMAFEEKTAGGLMTTEFVFVGEEASVEGAIAALRNYEGSIESIHAVYLINSQTELTGGVTLARILVADAETPLSQICMDPFVSLPAHEDETSVIDLFHKYNLVSLPVVDEANHMLGVVTADDVLARVMSRV